MTVEWKESLIESPITIGVLGRIGVGKSTLSNGLGKRLKLAHLEENFPLNPFLEKFYDNPKEWSFKSQVWFLERKIEQLKGLDPKKSYLIDPALEMDRLYAKTLAEIGFMSRDEFRTYDDLFETLVKESSIRKPDIFLRIDASLPVVRERIKKRGRAFELKMLEEYPFYLSELGNAIKNFVASQKGTNVLYVNASNDNFIDNVHLNALAASIKRKLNE